jgi:hypothetical protein
MQPKRRIDACVSDIEFDPKHPKSRTYVQRLARTKSQVMTVCFNGQFSQYQTEEDSIRGGHPNTAAIKNDLAEVQLGFFLPWEQMPLLFQRHASEFNSKRDACSKIWNIVEPTLSAHNRNFAQNMELLRKSREDGRIDAALRNKMAGSIDDFDYDIDTSIDPPDLDSDAEDIPHSLQQEFTSDAFISAYHSIATSWGKERITASKRIPSLSPAKKIRSLQSRSLLPLDVFQIPTFDTSGLRFIHNMTLQNWKSQIKGLVGLDELENTEAEDRIAFETENFDVDLGDSVLRPTLNLSSIETLPNLSDRRAQVGDNPSVTTLMSTICEDISLNTKQRLTVQRVLSAQ